MHLQGRKVSRGLLRRRSVRRYCRIMLPLQATITTITMFTTLHPLTVQLMRSRHLVI